MYPDNPENPMVRGAQDELERRSANDSRQARAFAMLVDEFLDACSNGLDAPLSNGDGAGTLADVLLDMTERPSVADYLAHKYAETELARYIDEGAFDA